MDYYAPVQLYAILAIGLAWHSVVTSRLVLKHPHLVNTGIPTVADSILFLTWIPLLVYQVALFTGMSPRYSMSPEAIPYQDIPNEFSRICRQIAYFTHMFVIFMFFFCIPSLFVLLGYDIPPDDQID